MLKSLGASLSSLGGIPESQKGQANGVATLDGAGHVPAAQIDAFTGWSVNGANALVPATPSTQSVGTGASPLHAVISQGYVLQGAQIASNGSFTDTDPDEIYMDATSGNLTAQVTVSSTSNGKSFLFKKTDASVNTVTVSLNTGTIEGQATIVLSSQYDYVRIRKVNTSFFIIGASP